MESVEVGRMGEEVSYGSTLGVALVAAPYAQEAMKRPKATLASNNRTCILLESTWEERLPTRKSCRVTGRPVDIGREAIQRHEQQESLDS